MPDPVDFVPVVCAGTSIFECLFNLKECKLKEGIKEAPDIERGFKWSFGTVIDIEAELDIADACILAGVIEAFAIAKKPFPTLPPPDPPIDFSAVEADLTSMIGEVTTPLGILDPYFTLEFDASKVTRIIS